MEKKEMSLTRTISWWRSAGMVVITEVGSISSPENTSSYMAATRAGVSIRPSRPASSPTPSRISLTPWLILSRSMCLVGWRFQRWLALGLGHPYAGGFLFLDLFGLLLYLASLIGFPLCILPAENILGMRT